MSDADVSPVTLEMVREFWERNPVSRGRRFDRLPTYEFLRYFDNLRERDDVEPYPFSNRIHGYETARGLSVVDYGCGNGYVLANYAKNGATVVGVDITKAAIRLSRERFRIMDLPGTFMQTDGSTIPLRSASFDIACSMGVLHQVPDPAPIVRELYRVLKPGGRLIVMVYNRNSYRYQVDFRWSRRWGRPYERGLSLGDLVKLNDGAGNPYGLVYTREELRQLLGDFRDHQFTVGQFGISELVLHKPWLIRIFSRVLPVRFVTAFLGSYVGWNLYCEAVKPR